MAIFRPSTIVGAISGNLGGFNFVIGRHGAFVRKRILKNQQNSKTQLKQRTLFANAYLYWIDATEQERQSWRQAAKLITFPNKLGIQRNLTGWQLYLKFTLQEQHDGPLALNPPLNLYRYPSVQNLQLNVLNPTSFVASWDQIGSSNSFNITWQFTRTLSSSPRIFFNNWKFVLKEKPPPATFQQELFDPVVAVWGRPQGDEVIAVRARFSDNNTFAGPWSVASTIR